jgi:class 3 adenylate cyclase
MRRRDVPNDDSSQPFKRLFDRVMAGEEISFAVNPNYPSKMKPPLSMLLSRKMRSFIRSGEESESAMGTVPFTGIGTVMFTDIIGSKGVFEGMNVDELASIMNESAALVPATINANNGFVWNFIGDAALAYWHPSHTNPSHAKEAFTCGSEILRAFQRLQKTRAASFGIRVALGTGDMTVSVIGGKLQAVGRAVATANRLLKLDLPRRSSMLCTEETLQMIPDASIPPKATLQLQRSYGTVVNVYEFTEV